MIIIMIIIIIIIIIIILAHHGSEIHGIYDQDKDSLWYHESNAQSFIRIFLVL